MYFERLEKWEQILEVVDDAEPEVERRQFLAIRITLLCARARALAQLGKHAKAEAALATAVRACPKGAIDPLIVVEASRGLCSALAGMTELAAHPHFERALAGCRAIGHRFHEAWIERSRPPVAVRVGGTSTNTQRSDASATALVLGDVAAILGAGHSVDLLGHRLTAILEQTALAPRLQIESESGQPFRSESSLDFQTSPNGVSTIHLRGSDRRMRVLGVSDVHSLDDIALLKNIVDVVQVSVAPHVGPGGRRRPTDPLARGDAIEQRRDRVPVAADGRAAPRRHAPGIRGSADPDHRRDRNRQGGPRAFHPRVEPRRARALRRVQLRDDAT